MLVAIIGISILAAVIGSVFLGSQFFIAHQQISMV